MSQDNAVAYGKRLLTTTIDTKAFTDPQAVWCSLPYDDHDLAKGYEDITYQRLANAINYLAWFIHEKLGPFDKFETVMYMGPPDIRYQLLEFAIVKTGYKVLFSSHMNSLDGHLNLIDKTDAKIMLSARQVKVEDILSVRPMKHILIPELDDILNAPDSGDYSYHKTFEEAKDDPFLILHTSGSTGAPKPVEFTLGAVSALDHHQSVPLVDPASGLAVSRFLTGSGRPCRTLIPFLPFHGIISSIVMAGTIFGELVWIPGFRHKMVTTNDIPKILENCQAEIAFFSPAVVEDLARKPDVGKSLSGLERCLYGGATVTDTAAKVFSKYTHLQNQWGMTEINKLVDLEPPPEDYDYCGFELKASGLTFEPVADGLYEMVIRRTPDSYPNASIFWRFPDIEEYRPGDLWSPHPDPAKAKYLWRYRGRTDDLINWKDGTAFQPIGYESKHSEHELIRSAVMAGTGHRQPVLLLEMYSPLTESSDRSAILNKIWEESVVPTNLIAPTNGQVAKTHIIIASPEKPFDRSMKGTVARKSTVRKYECEIAAVYDQFGDKGVPLNGRII